MNNKLDIYIKANHKNIDIKKKLNRQIIFILIFLIYVEANY